ncbi:hypothetical protein CMV30_10415 [Nibricoccus aquaticus]|uniref:Protein kinase domain-containing protein n=1 Tax=Nibricoccus aquaticus TaxID=2576891 RepID=A0A290Q771_9BACT|nr:protein kinase [Nibricoccus aquaticus]ATC64334.1 hypothetical protein CMV30_10415 [Nibricoccus aquaticus]
MSSPTSNSPSSATPGSAKCPHCGRALPANAPLGACPHCLLAAGLTSEPAAPSNSAPPPSPADLAPDFPQLEILELLGRGGMGAVYKARQKSLDRHVALKLLRPGLDADPSFADRFTREARALAKLNHPGIVTLYEFGHTSSGRFFILMEFVDGLNLRQLLAAGRLSPREALAIVPPLCDALQYAHDRGLIHRDIKPENLLIDRLGRVKIADFGLAKITATSAGRDGSPSPSETPAPALTSDTDHWSLSIGHSSLTETGRVMGTPEYMAPEQRAHPAAVDHRADIYALGVVLYQLLTGELPDAQQLQPPSQRVHLDIRLDAIVLRALEKNPALRYSAATELKTHLETIASSSTPPGAPTSPSASAPSSAVPLSPTNSVSDPSALPPFRASAIFSHPRLKFWLLRVAPITLLVLLALRFFVIAPYRIEGSSIEPEIPAGSLAFVYKLNHHFTPGDIVAYHHTESLTYVARVTTAGPIDNQLLVSRRDQPPIAIAASSVIGGVIFNTRNNPQHSPNSVSATTTITLTLLFVALAALAFLLWKISKRSPASSPRTLPLIAAAFLLLNALHLLWIFSTADELPATVASHFGMNGRADGYMSKSGYLAFTGLFPLGLGLLFQGAALLMRRLPDEYINIPHRAIWLSPDRRPQLIAILQSWLATLSCALVLFFAQLHTLTLLAHRLHPIRLPDIALFTLIGFPSLLMLWAIGLLMRLAEPHTAAKLHTRRSLILAIVSATLLGFFSAPTAIAWSNRAENKPSPKLPPVLTSSIDPTDRPNDSTTPAKPTPAAESSHLRIQVPANTEYSKVIALLDAAKKADFNQIAFDTFPAAQSPSPAATAALPSEAQQEILRLKLAEAKSLVALAKTRVEAGTSTNEELHAAQDTVAILEAELLGDQSKITQTKIAAAKRRLAAVSERHKAGMVGNEELHAAKDEVTLLEAELANDPLKSAQIKVVSAKRRLDEANTRVETGTATAEVLSKAKTELAIRELELNELLKTQPAP